MEVDDRVNCRGRVRNIEVFADARIEALVGDSRGAAVNLVFRVLELSDPPVPVRRWR